MIASFDIARVFRWTLLTARVFAAESKTSLLHTARVLSVNDIARVFVVSHSLSLTVVVLRVLSVYS